MIAAALIALLLCSAGANGIFEGVWQVEPFSVSTDRVVVQVHDPAFWPGSLESSDAYDVFNLNGAEPTYLWSSWFVAVIQNGSTFNITYDNGNSAVGSLSGDGTVIEWTDGSTWVRYTDSMSGIWQGWFNRLDVLDEVYVLTKNGSNFNVICDTTVNGGSPCGWVWGSGTINGNDVSLKLVPGSTLTGKLSANGSVISWENNSTWGMAPGNVFPTPIRKVHVVFMNHLDVGYNGIPELGFVNNILNIYFHEYFPRAIGIAAEMRALGGNDRFVYTTHPWLLSLFLDCPPNFILSGIQLICPNAAEIQSLTDAIARGDITWHAGPFNLQPENMEPSLFEAALGVAADLNTRFGFNTRDVPFMTRSVIPLLLKNGVEAITVGTNDACYFPQVPKAFIWLDPVSNESIIALEHPHGYGGITIDDCVEAPNGVGLCFAFRTDNAGPPVSTDEVLRDLDYIRSQFPQAQVFASTYPAFIADIMPIRDSLPVFSTEFGDTWIYGVPSDPLKNARYREILRARVECYESGMCTLGDPVLANFTREHTWGQPAIYSANFYTDYSNEALQASWNTQPYIDVANSWNEQRVFIDFAIEALQAGGHPLAAIILERLALLTPQVPNLDGFSQVLPITSAVQVNGVTIQFDLSGAIVTLEDPVAGVSWASAADPVAKFVYQTLSDAEYIPFCDDYMLSHSLNGGFAKPGSEKYTQSAFWFPTLQQILTKGNTIIAVLTMPEITTSKYGAPQTIYLNVTAVRQEANVTLFLDLQWFNKTSTRIPESFSFAFSPVQNAGAQWWMDKLGEPVDPTDVGDGGCQTQHAVWSGVQLVDAQGVLDVVSLDAPIVMPMIPSFVWGNPLPYPLTPLTSMPFGMSYNLFNNLWNTNYILFYPYTLGEGDENARFRFAVQWQA